MAAITLWKPPFDGTAYSHSDSGAAGDGDKAQSGNRRPRATFLVRKVTAQATVGQTDWLRVPEWALYAEVRFKVTATAGTTPIFLPQLVSADPISLDDASTPNIGNFATSGGITSTGEVVYTVGPGVTGIANAGAAVGGSGSSHVFANDLLPELLGIKVVNDRTTGDETYTYTVTVHFTGNRA